MLLDKINFPADLKSLSLEEMEQLAEELRCYILDVISERGGHLASSLGVVELTIALHYVFNAPSDRIIWDVGHQTYAHKILTGRREAFKNVRRHGGISGFPKRNESEYDPYDVGHSSTSISLATGEAAGRDLNGKDYKVVTVIGDGSLTGGMAFEALNHLGHIGKDVIVILNDNEHSISKNVGALSSYMTEMISGNFYNRLRKKSMQVIKNIPIIGNVIFEIMFRLFASFKSFIITGQLFETMGLRYFGPVDGHNIEKLVEILDRVKNINSGPKLVHIITKKGKGFGPAESDPCSFHGTGPFNRETGVRKAGGGAESYSSVAGRTLAAIAETDDKVVAVTAAMKEGTGLNEFEKVAPERIFDVGIAEQHALTFSAAMASTGLKPFLPIYSSFLQRAYDQLIHDVAIMNLPVRILIDRAGIVGDDGETHHGLFDISMIMNIPNMEFLSPSNGEELRDMIYYACKKNDGPVAIRYPRGSSGSVNLNVHECNEFKPGKIRVLSRGADIALIAVGDMVQTALDASYILKNRGVAASVVNLLSMKPVDIKGVSRIIENCSRFVILENGYSRGGIGDFIYSKLEPALCGKKLFDGGFPETFITHGTVKELFKDYAIDPESLADRISAEFKKKKGIKK